jgi:glyoxylase-like metal-dependent hydrolase (beta-lactamase superfamily II)
LERRRTSAACTQWRRIVEIEQSTETQILFPFPEPPRTGEFLEVSPGILWLRVPLPFRLNHINIYLIDDGDGWAVLDTGIANGVTRDIWEVLLSGPLAGRKLTRLIVTHYHPDHIGLAGWLAGRFGLPLLTTQTTYLQCLTISLNPRALDAQIYRDFYHRNGLKSEIAAIVASNGHGYLKMVTPLPPVFQRIAVGDRLKIGGRTFKVLIGEGHAPEQAMLHCKEENLLFAADQVLERISPNVSVWAVDPHGDPLGLYLRSLRELEAQAPEDVLVLPGHHRPFVGLQVRTAELAAHHANRCDAIESAALEPKSAAELLPAIFHHELDAHEMSFAFSEVLAHINYMLRQGTLAWAEPLGGIERVVVPREPNAA